MTPVALKFLAARRIAVVVAVVAGLGLALTGAAVTAPAAGATNSALPTPSWWNGVCDDGHYFAVTGRHSYPLGASFLGVQVCGPRHGSDGGPDVLWTRAGWGEYEWECPELAFRFMYLAYGISSAWHANGNTVYDNYNPALYGGGLVKIADGTVGSAPMPGDVMSFNATATSSAGHVAVVESSSVDANGNGSLRLITQNDTADGWRTLTVTNWSVKSGGLGSTIGWLHKPGWWTGPGSQPAVQYHSLAPSRLMDTRADPAYHVGPAHRFGAGETQDLTVTGGSVPADATGVVMNVTAVDPTLASHIDVWPSGGSRPNVSNLNVTAGQTVANLVTAKVGAGGRVSLANNAGSVDVVVDLVGYFEADPAGSRLTPFVPRRVIDTRADPSYHIGPVSRLGASPAAQNVTVVGGSTGVPSGATAVVANVTVVDPSAASHLDVWPAGDVHPNASNINFVAGQTVPNLVVVKVGAGNQISLVNQIGSVDVIVDIVGYYRVDPAAAGFVALDPTRVADTRSDPAYHVGPLTRFDDQRHDLLVTGGVAGIPADAIAVVANVTAVDPSMASHLDVWPAGSIRPDASNLNFTAGRTVPNLVVVKIGPGGKISLQNQVGAVDVIVDVVGYYR